MVLATTKVEDFDRFLKTSSTKGAEKQLPGFGFSHAVDEADDGAAA